MQLAFNASYEKRRAHEEGLVSKPDIHIEFGVDEFLMRKLIKQPVFPAKVPGYKTEYYHYGEMRSFLAVQLPDLAFNIQAQRFIRGEFDTEATRNKYRGKQKPKQRLRNAA